MTKERPQDQPKIEYSPGFKARARENDETSTENTTTELRKRLFSYLECVLQTSLKKFKKTRASDADRRSWVRVIIQAIGTYTKVYELSELANLEERIRVLEGKTDV